MFKDDGTIIHFSWPIVLAAEHYNTFVVAGHSETKRFEEFLPGIINQVGPDYLESMNRIAIPSVEEAVQVLSEVSLVVRGAEETGPGEAALDEDLLELLGLEEPPQPKTAEEAARMFSKGFMLLRWAVATDSGGGASPPDPPLIRHDEGAVTLQDIPLDASDPSSVSGGGAPPRIPSPSRSTRGREPTRTPLSVTWAPSLLSRVPHTG